MKGVIQSYNSRSGSGVVRTGEGATFSFGKGDWKETKPPARDERVEFTANGKRATAIHLVPGKANAAVNLYAIDYGWVAGVFTVVFMLAILDVFFNILKLNLNDIAGLGVILYILVVISWISGTKYKLLRGLATGFALAVTAIAMPVILKHL